jgi:hypothetical protein
MERIRAMRKARKKPKFPVVIDQGNGNFLVQCEHCGKPLSKTSEDFGMDCEDSCGEKALGEAGEAGIQELMDILNGMHGWLDEVNNAKSR